MKTEFISGANNGSIGNLAACLPPIGSIIAIAYYSQLYGAGNNNVAGINAGLPAQWRVCSHGATVSDVDSPINGVALPDLTDGRFLRGYTVAGETNGSETITVANLPSHDHPISHAASDGHYHNSGNLTAAIAPDVYFSPTVLAAELRSLSYTANWSFSIPGTGPIGVAARSRGAIVYGSTDGPSGGTAASVGSTGSGTAYTPKYFTCFYAMRIK